MKPKVSICIPTYNQKPEYLRECVRSALQQRYDSLEVVVSDNHSDNDAPAVLSEFNDTRLKVISPPVHLNMSGNFAFCAEQSTGEYINFLSSDDLLNCAFCSRMSQILDEYPKVSFAHAAIYRIDTKGYIIGKERTFRGSFVRPGRKELSRYLWGPRAALPSTLIRRTDFNAVGGFREPSMVADWDLYLRLLGIGDVAFCSEVFASHRIWPSSETQVRVLDQIRAIRYMYDSIIPTLFNLTDQDKTTVRRARRSWALGFASSTHFARKDINGDELSREISLLNNGFLVKCYLLLQSLGMGLPLLLAKRLRLRLGQIVKAAIFP